MNRQNEDKTGGGHIHITFIDMGCDSVNEWKTTWNDKKANRYTLDMILTRSEDQLWREYCEK